MRTRLSVIVIILISIFGTKELKAQGIAVKTNLAGWAAFAPNIGVDLCLSESSSIEAIFYKSAADCWVKDVNFTALQLGYKYWFDHEPMNSLFCGFTATPTRYELNIKDTHRVGDCVPFGVNVGYCWPLGDRWNLEISYGIGATLLFEECYNYDIFGNDIIYSRTKLGLSPSNIGINISYIIK